MNTDFPHFMHNVFRSLYSAVIGKQNITITHYPHEHDYVLDIVKVFLHNKEYQVEDDGFKLTARPMTLVERMNKMRGESWE